MKVAAVIAKILTALATVAGAIYLLATYGDKIVAWCKNLLDSMPKVERWDGCCDEEEEEVEETVADAVEEVAQDVAEAVEEVVEEVVEAAEDVVADEADFEG